MFRFFRKKSVPSNNHQEKTETIEEFKDVSIIANYFKNETGVTFDKQTTILRSKVITFCKQRDIYSFEGLLKKTDESQELKQELINYLTTNETFFYREFKQIEELVKLVKKTDKKVDILCSPSATGEEAYSIIIALLEAGVSSENFHITGIDINSEAITKANQAAYKERNVRNLTPEIIEKYFTKKSDTYAIKENLKQLVSFKLKNLFDPSFKNLGKFDFVFSRNMLIYFDKETKQKAKEILESMRKNETQEVFFGHADLF